MNKSGTLLWNIFDDYIPPPVSQKSKQRGDFFVTCNGVSYLHDAAISPTQQFYFIPRGVFQQEPAENVRNLDLDPYYGGTIERSLPSSRFCSGGIMGFLDLRIVQAIQ